VTSARWNERHGRILSDILLRFTQSGIRYFILRNFENLPNINPSKDVDIMVDTKHTKEAKAILLNIYRAHGVSNYYEARHGFLHCCHGMDVKGNFSIHIDLIFSYVSKGFEIFTFDELYKHTENYNEFRVLNNYFEGVMVFIYKQFNYTPRLKNEYKEIIYNVYKIYPDFSVLLRDLVGRDLASKILATIEDRRFDDMVLLSGDLTKKLRRFAFAKQPLKTGYLAAAFYTIKGSKIIFRYRKYAKSFSVIAPDGSGKTTFLEKLLEEIDFFFVNDKSDNRCHVYHFRPNLLPNLGAIGEKVGIKEQDKDFINPHRSEPAGGFSSLVRISYYWLDYILGYNLYVRQDVQFDRFSVFDRYSYDLIVDPARTRLSLPFWVRKLFVKLMPHPSIVFYLDADPAVVFGRKQELQLDEIARQKIAYRALAETHDRFVSLDANRPAEKSANEALQVILDRFTKRL
jgi:thymidylate kinase